MHRSVRRALLLVASPLAAEQTVDHRKQEKKFTFPQDVTGTVEYRAATWAQKTFPNIRFFLPGSMAQWANTFTDVQQFTGGSFTMATNQVQQRADTAIGFGAADVQEDVRLTLTWLKAYGVGVIAISGKDSQEYWRAVHPSGEIRRRAARALERRRRDHVPRAAARVHAGPHRAGERAGAARAQGAG